MCPNFGATRTTLKMIEDFRRNHLFNGEDLGDAGNFADAVCKILDRCYPHFDQTFVRKGFRDIEEAFFGRFEGLLACDTPYHDLRHSLDTSLVMARMVDGFEMAHSSSEPALGVTEGCLAVLLALFHDIGFLRKDTESDMCGASLAHDHEQRSVDFMRKYLAGSPFSDFSDQAQLIHATNFAMPISQTLSGLPHQLFVIGQMLGTADLLSQMSGRYYLENCRDYLFQEFIAAGEDRTVTSNGVAVVVYATPEDLLRKTPLFYDRVVRVRLEHDFSHIYRYLANHFGGVDPHVQGMQRNLSFLNELISRNDFSLLNRQSTPQIPLAHGNT
jgi:hypothetical protein